MKFFLIALSLLFSSNVFSAQFLCKKIVKADETLRVFYNEGYLAIFPSCNFGKNCALQVFEPSLNQDYPLFTKFLNIDDQKIEVYINTMLLERADIRSVMIGLVTENDRGEANPHSCMKID